MKFEPDETTRRQIIRATLGAAALGLAGCTQQQNDGGDGGDGGSSDGSSNGGGGGGGGDGKDKKNKKNKKGNKTQKKKGNETQNQKGNKSQDGQDQEEESAFIPLEKLPKEEKYFYENADLIWNEGKWLAEGFPAAQQEYNFLMQSIKLDLFEFERKPKQIGLSRANQFRTYVEDLYKLTQEVGSHYHKPKKWKKEIKERFDVIWFKYADQIKTYADVNDVENLKSLADKFREHHPLYIEDWNRDKFGFRIKEISEIDPNNFPNEKYAYIRDVIEPNFGKNNTSNLLAFSYPPKNFSYAFTDSVDAGSWASQTKKLYEDLPLVGDDRMHFGFMDYTTPVTMMVVKYENAKRAKEEYGNLLEKDKLYQGQTDPKKLGKYMKVGRAEKITWQSGGEPWYAFAKRVNDYVYFFHTSRTHWEDKFFPETWATKKKEDPES